ncbi:uncharacterized protein F5891DRAFT_1189080 [Suillus fuscotomentosus]|uniref:DUF6533 domain-containing protein n=1 Tax=Suillus fuscotomentosus TaxID=1912939 RepID=A0AAD4HKM6_9AGAM|nr:uncharacterized protein F5891DRAFT_1189080 [Suillus fuscotomentosus]KAG1899997.1 hypothetical protein F5891DRAFT_1189080 [Suillus fuscotomentosus]
MTYVSNDPRYWPFISGSILVSYCEVVAGIVVVYDWVLTLGQEIELIWRQCWSLMTALYLIIRYIGIPFSLVNILGAVMNTTDNVIGVTLTAMLGVIIIARLYAMYQGSRTMLMFLVIIFLAVNIACGVLTAMALNDTVIEEFIFSGLHLCGYPKYGEDRQLLFAIIWVLSTVWEVLALCLSVWVAVKRFRELHRLGSSTGSTIGDCFRVLIQFHVLYFASFVGVSCIQLAQFSPEIANSTSIGAQILLSTVQILLVVQIYVLGPRLILSVREYNAKLVAYSDAETSMNSIVFQEHVHVSTSTIPPNDAPLVPSRFRPYPPEVYVYCYQQYLHATGQVPGPPNLVPPPPPHPHHLGGYPPAFQGMGVPPAAALLQHPSAPPSAQPSHHTHSEQGPEEQAPVADAEESAVKRGKRKAVDLDDDDAPPRKKQTIHPLVDYPDFELVQNNGEVRYRCCLPQCENVPAVPRAGIAHSFWLSTSPFLLVLSHPSPLPHSPPRLLPSSHLLSAFV